VTIGHYPFEDMNTAEGKVAPLMEHTEQSEPDALPGATCGTMFLSTEWRYFHLI